MIFPIVHGKSSIVSTITNLSLRVSHMFSPTAVTSGQDQGEPAELAEPRSKTTGAQAVGPRQRGQGRFERFGDLFGGRLWRRFFLDFLSFFPVFR